MLPLALLLVVLALLFWPRRTAKPRRHGRAQETAAKADSAETQRAREVGELTGLLGGSIEDAFVARYTLEQRDAARAENADS